MKSTKAFARELGLLRKRSSTSSLETQLKKISKTGQQFGYFIVIDFESTCWKEKQRTQEIIEFPAVLLNAKSGEIDQEFHRYVQPQENPTLSAFCRELTGISQEQVDNGIPLPICLSNFNNWLRKLRQDEHIYIFGDPSFDGNRDNLCAFITWSDWDLAVCLQYECRRKQLRKPKELESWIDLRATYRRFYDRKPKGLNGALQDLGLDFEGREHSGLHDSRNTARLAWRLMCDGCVLAITKTPAARGVSTTNPMAAMKMGVCLAPPVNRHRGSVSAEANIISGHPTSESGHGNNLAEGSDINRQQKNEILRPPATRGPGQVITGSLRPPVSAVARTAGLGQPVTGSLRPPGSAVSRTASRGQSLTGSLRHPVSTVRRSLGPGQPLTCSLRPPASAVSRTVGPGQPMTGSLRPPVSAVARTAGLGQPVTGSLRPPGSAVSRTAGLGQSLTGSLRHPVSTVRRSLGPGQPLTCSLRPPASAVSRTVGPGQPMTGSLRPTVSAVSRTAGPGQPMTSSLRPPVSAVVRKTGTILQEVTSLRVNANFGVTPKSNALEAKQSVLNRPETTIVSNVKQNARSPGTTGALDDKAVRAKGGSDVSTRDPEAPTFKTPPLPCQPPGRVGTDSAGTGRTVMKRTPPMCQCGRRATRKLVQSPGPNLGRFFFACSHGRNSDRSCQFFKWEPPVSPSAVGSSPALTRSAVYRQPPHPQQQKPWQPTTPTSAAPRLPQPRFESPDCVTSGHGKKTIGVQSRGIGGRDAGKRM